jgi:hypothetical protein
MPERSDRKFEREGVKRKTEADAKRAEEIANARSYARRIVALFNARATRAAGDDLFLLFSKRLLCNRA